MKTPVLAVAAIAALGAQAARAAEVVVTSDNYVHVGVSGLWVLANFSYAGMRAQGNPSTGWRIASFIFGFPGTLVSFFAVKEASQRAYGVDLPSRGPRS